MIRRRTLKIIAVVMAVIAAVTVLLGYDLVYERRVTDDPAPRHDLF